MKRIQIILNIIILLIFSAAAYPQNVTERVILTAESEEEAKDLYYTIGLNKNGDYGFVLKKDKSEYFVSGADTIGPFPVHSQINSTHFSTKVRSSYVIELDSTTNKEFYIKNKHNPKFYGEFFGEVIDFKEFGADVVLVVKTDDTINVYFNDSLLVKLDYTKKEKFDPHWDFKCKSGNIICKVRKNNKEYIYCNYKLVDSTDGEISGFDVNEYGKYIYSVDFTDSSESVKKTYSYIHTEDTVIGPVRKISSVSISPDGGTSAYSVKDGVGEFIINNNLSIYDCENEDDVPCLNSYGLYIRDSLNFLQHIKTANGCNLNVNGIRSYRNYDKIYCPVVDSYGNYSFFGLRDYYLFRCVNGTEDTVPLSRYGVRAFPIYISPEGGISYYYYDNNDSIYVYRNDSLLFRTISSDYSFNLWREVFDQLNHSEFKLPCTDLIYIRVDTTAYFIYKGLLSKPLPHARNDSNENVEGKLLSGELRADGFYAIRSLGKGTLFVVVNNKCYETIYYVDEFFKDYVYFDDNELVFYIFSGDKIIRYAINEK